MLKCSLILHKVLHFIPAKDKERNKAMKKGRKEEESKQWRKEKKEGNSVLFTMKHCTYYTSNNNKNLRMTPKICCFTVLEQL